MKGSSLGSGSAGGPMPSQLQRWVRWCSGSRGGYRMKVRESRQAAFRLLRSHRTVSRSCRCTPVVAAPPSCSRPSRSTLDRSLNGAHFDSACSCHRFFPLCFGHQRSGRNFVRGCIRNPGRGGNRICGPLRWRAGRAVLHLRPDKPCSGGSTAIHLHGGAAGHLRDRRLPGPEWK